MTTKIQELTEKLYLEGLEKGKQESEKIIEEAKKQAKDILQSAEHEAEKIIANAKKESDDLKSKVEADIKLASKQILSVLKQKITDFIVTKVVDSPVQKALEEQDYVKKIIETIITNWTPKKSGPVELSLLLPANKEEEFADFFLKKGRQLLDEGLEVKFDTRLKSGFKIGPKESSYKISFTDEDFINFFKAYLRPKTAQLLFEEK
ncbi:MAG: hypothetical protein JW866_06220 [Ignavibacteriales bacterium]|nr:hypothetical protein [Ignavibacteriales bacterium]